MALFAWLVLGETLGPIEWVGIALAAAGMITLAMVGQTANFRSLIQASRHPAALSGLGAGFCFAWTAIFIRAASDSLGASEPVLRALITLIVMNVMQTVMQGGWMAAKERTELIAAVRAWRRAGWVGLLSAAGSACWFTSFTLAPVALVRTLGQVEIPLVLLFSHFLLHERIHRREVAGLLLVMGGAALVVVSSGLLSSVR